MYDTSMDVKIFTFDLAGKCVSTFVLRFWWPTFILHLFIVLCTSVHAGSVMNYACVMFCPCPPPIFKMYVSEIKESTFKIMLSEMKISGE